MKARPLTFAVWCLAVSCAAVADSKEFSRKTSAFQYGAERARDEVIAPETGADFGEVVSQEVRESDTELLRIHFKVLKGTADPDWRVEVHGPNGLVSTDRPAGRASFWSGEVPASKAIVKIFFERKGVSAAVHVDKVIVSVKVPNPQGITTTRAHIEPIDGEDAIVKALGRSVARLSLINQFTGLVADYCTGFLVGPNLLLTNEHCMPTEEGALSVIVEFDYDRSDAKTKKVRVTGRPASSYRLDYALAVLDETPSGIVPMRLHPQKLSEGQDLLLIHHPEGEPKKVSRKNCKINLTDTDGRADGTDFGHLCNSLGGSSGSPIVDETKGWVVGLHHLGFLAGTVDPHNQGVKLGLILEDLEERFKPMYRQLKVE